MARLAANAIVPVTAVAAVPAVYVEIDGEDACLSVWGKLVWNTEKERILSGALLEHPGLQYEASFVKDYEKCRVARHRVAFQESLAKAAVLWALGGLEELRKDGGLLYETYKNRNHIGHFRVGQGDRVSCLPQDDVLILRHMGAHDYVNDSP